MARTPAGLTDEQVGSLRTALLANKRPKVTVAGQQFGGETTGQVVTVGEPEAEGPEFIQVRVTLDGLTDVLRFAPQELRLPQRGRTPAAPATAPTTARAPRRAATPKPVAAAVDGAVVSTPARPAAVKPQPAAPPAARPSAAPASPAAAPPGVAKPQAAVTPPAAFPAAAPKTAPRSRKAAGRPPTVTITITFTGTDWTVTAHRGGTSVLKAVPIAPGVVAGAVELLGEQAISAAVDAVNGAALSLAQQRAEELRAELAAVESVLAAHRTPGRRTG